MSDFGDDNYKRKLLSEEFLNQLKETSKPGTVSIVNVYHDDWCKIYKGGKCNCNPDLVTEQA